jgi:hypothetical protein
MRTGEANTSAHSEEAYGASGHGENVRPVSGRSNHGAFRGSLDGLKKRITSFRVSLG